MPAESVAGVLARYSTLLWQVGEFLAVTVGLYVLGRFAVEPAGAWGSAERDWSRRSSGHCSECYVSASSSVRY